MLLDGSALKGYPIEASDGRVGTVSDLLFDDTSWKIRWLVVDTGTWLAERKVLVHPASVLAVDLVRREIRVKLTKSQVEHSPDIRSDKSVSRQMESSLYDYYGWDPYWGSSYFGAGAIASPLQSPAYFGAPTIGEAERAVPGLDKGDPHLRSTQSVMAYHVHAKDGLIGHVESFLIESASWGIHYILVDTSNWWLGNHVLISPYAVTKISWEESEIHLNVTRAKVKASPLRDVIAPIDQSYERVLHRYYEWDGYGF